jgi:glycosyltransferase involved in cell wall biosynthesis
MKAGYAPAGGLHLVWLYPDAIAGKLDAASYLEMVRELRAMGWRVTLVAAGPAGEHLIRGVAVLCLSKPRIYLLSQLLFHVKVLRLLLRQWDEIDVILFHPMSTPWILPLRAVRRLKRGSRPLLVMDVRTVPMSADTPKDWLRARYHQAMQWLANRWADGQTAITGRMAAEVRIPPARLWGVWPSGVDLDLFGPAQLDRRWPIAGDPVHLIYTGLLNHERNLMPLCRAVEEANAGGMAFCLRLVGRGTQQQELQEFSAQTDGRIRVLPPIPHDQVPQLLAWAHVGVLPFPDEQRFRVSSPIKLFEYMAAGLPVLATRIDCHTDVLREGDHVFWAAGAGDEGLLEALHAIWLAKLLLEEKGQEAARGALEWTWRESANKLAAALNYGLGTGGGNDET